MTIKDRIQIVKYFSLKAMKEEGFRKTQLTGYANDLFSEIEKTDFREAEKEYDNIIINL